MSTNFDFLRNFDNDLHYLACVIEDEIYSSPSAVLTDATTFLEIIIYDIIRKNELEADDLVYFKDKVLFLSELGFLSPELKKYMLKAYSIRNKMHSYNGDAKNHIHLNQMRAVHIHRLLFNVSWLYYSENADNKFKTTKPSYTHPSRIKDETLIQSEIGNGKCIICEAKTKSNDELFCRQCKYKIEKSDNLKTLRKHIGFKKGFRRNDLIEMGFEKGYVGPFLQELKNDDLIYSVAKMNMIDRENAGRYIEEAEAMIAIEKLLSDFRLRNVSLDDVFEHEFFLMGREGLYPYVGFYHLFREIQHSNFITLITQENDIAEIIDRSHLTKEEIREWYFSGETPEHEIFREKITLEIIRCLKTGDDIDSGISEDILEDVRKSNDYMKREDEFLFSSFINLASKEKVTKDDALEAVGLSDKDLERLFRQYPEFRERFEKSYTKHKMEKFLKHLDYYNYDYCLKKTGVTLEEIQIWLSEAEKSDDEDYKAFLEGHNKLIVKRYVEHRKNGNTRYKSCKNIHCDSQRIAELLGKYDNDLDEYLAGESVKLFRSGKSMDEIIKKLDLTQAWFSEAIEKGMKGDEIYTDLYHEYSQNAVPNMLSEFMETVREKSLRDALKELDIDENEFESWYEQGKNSVPPYDSFYEELVEYKKETYVKTMIKTGSKQKAAKKSLLTADELNEYEDVLDEMISAKSMEIVISELEKGNTTKKASKKASVKIADIYDWIDKALNGDEDYAEFLKVYKKEYLVPIRMGYAKGVKEGVGEKEIIRTMKRNEFLVNDDVKHLKRLGLFPKPGDEVIELDEELEIE